MRKTAILGFGTVGSGVADLLTESAERISALSGEPCELSYILDVRKFPGSPHESLFVENIEVILCDADVRVVCETIGGVSAALDYTRRALAAGKNVVTSNKELVAMHGQELLALAKEHDVNYLFEASVGGGIPIIRPLSQCLLSENINEIYGILNGTTNYILTRMSRDGMGFPDALAEAQRLGYAERNPKDDVSGKDVCRKICILASLAFGAHVFPYEVQTEGIEKITGEDTAWAKENGYAVKLLGRAVKLGDAHITACVAPYMIPAGDILARVDDVYNGIVVCGDSVGDVMFYGRGAGKRPTAAAVVADVTDALKHGEHRRRFEWEVSRQGFVVPADTLSSPWYVRGAGKSREPVKGKYCVRIFGGADI